MSGAYPWIITRRFTGRALPPQKLGCRPRQVCLNCGWDWIGIRKACPACLHREWRTDAA